MTSVTWVAVAWLIRLHPDQKEELFVWCCEYESVCADLPGADTDCWRVHPRQEEPSYASVSRRECLLGASTQRQLQLWSKMAGPCLKLAAELSNPFGMGFEGMENCKVERVLDSSCVTELEIPMERPRRGALEGQPWLSWRLENTENDVSVGCSPRWATVLHGAVLSLREMCVLKGTRDMWLLKLFGVDMTNPRCWALRYRILRLHC